MEIITLAQTKKLERRIPILLYGPGYWKEIINFEALIRHEVISADDLDVFTFIDEPGAALAHLQRVIDVSAEPETPAFAHSCAGSS
jgi:predicted Rossmann-fold nucleotide-binding protein